MRVALFYLEDMIYRHRMIKASVGFMRAAEYVMPFIVVYHFSFGRKMVLN